MNRNQKIALGCGGAGCLGLIVVVIAGWVIYFFLSAIVPTRNYNIYTNRNSNINDNANATLTSELTTTTTRLIKLVVE